MNSLKVLSVFTFTVFFILNSCQQQGSTLKIDYEKYVLNNGLQVILHEDKSDPIVSVAIQYHVGSAREEIGKTGFAHLFEHMLFQESQHVKQDQFFKKVQGAGGTLNGGTWSDGTVYYEVVPKNALEMVLWLESDRMGFLLSTVTQEAFVNQQDVVMNEKRQSYDNRPYGQTSYIIDKVLYPEDHPYSWQTIGSMDDLRNATLADVHQFYNRWYGPNNATLVVAGDFDNAETRKLVEKYFGEIKGGQNVANPEVKLVTLNQTKRVYYEDLFAKSPELNMVFPSVQQFNEDAYALSLFGELFAEGKKAPLYKVIVEEQKLAPSVSGFQNSEEIAGNFRIRIRTFPEKNLSDVEKAIFTAFGKFEKDGFTDKDLARIKAKTETNFYDGISSVLDKSFQLAQYNVFAATPDFITQDLNNTLAVTKDDIWRVYNTYIKNKPYVLSSFVPSGQTSLIAENSEQFIIKEESIADQTAVQAKDSASHEIEKIASAFDRSIEPSMGPEPTITIPQIWEANLQNGIRVLGIEQNELPLIQFSVVLKGGMLLDDMNKIGVANLISDMLTEGTKNKTPIELEEAIEELGSDIRVFTSTESIVLEGNCLASKFDQTFALAEEILLEPRWDEKEFPRVIDETIEAINRGRANPATVANKVFNKILYGTQHILANSTLGTEESVKSVPIDDLKNYYTKYFSPKVASIIVVGALTKDAALDRFQSLNEKWQGEDIQFPEYPIPSALTKPSVYFVDFPDAKQSEIRIGYLALSYKDPDYYAATVMNYKLGGSFNGFLNLILREEKGFTYGARSGFSGSIYPGPFTASSSVRSNATLESVEIFKNEMTKYRNGLSDENLTFTKDALLKSNTRRFETLGSLRGMLDVIVKYDLPFDYIKDQEKIIQAMSQDRLRELAQKYIDPERMVYLIVGDAATQLKPLAKIGFGQPVLLDNEGNSTGGQPLSMR